MTPEPLSLFFVTVLTFNRLTDEDEESSKDAQNQNERASASDQTAIYGR